MSREEAFWHRTTVHPNGHPVTHEIDDVAKHRDGSMTITMRSGHSRTCGAVAVQDARSPMELVMRHACIMAAQDAVATGFVR